MFTQDDRNSLRQAKLRRKLPRNSRHCPEMRPRLTDSRRDVSVSRRESVTRIPQYRHETPGCDTANLRCPAYTAVPQRPAGAPCAIGAAARGHPAADCWFGGENEKSLTNGWEMARSSGGCGEAELPHQSVSLECAFSRQLIPIDLLQLLNRCLEALRIDEPIGIECVARFVLLVQSELRCV